MRIPRRSFWIVFPLVFIIIATYQPPAHAGVTVSQDPTPTPQPESEPAELVLSAFKDATDVTAGYFYTCAITTQGGVKCWGLNDSGQLGDGTEEPHATPSEVLELGAEVVAVSAGEDHTCAVIAEGKALCWGRNYFGQLGDGTTEDRLTPVEVTGLPEGATNIAASQWHTCALTRDGGVYCWGDNNYQKLGDGTNEDSLTPVPVQGLASGVLQITTGQAHTCALKGDGSVTCWGAPGFLGVEDYDYGPLLVPGLDTGVSHVSASPAHTCAVKGNEVYCWGANQYGQLGNGQTEQVQIAPVQVVGLQGQVSELALGMLHSCALTDEGVFCWGNNTFGQLGDGTSQDQLSPVAVQGLSGKPVSISAGLAHTCAVLEGGIVECWGLDRAGLLGSGKLLTIQTEPIQVVSLNEGVRAIGAGENSTCAALETGGIQCWGINDAFGLGLSLGYETPVNPGIPQNIEGLTGEFQTVVVGSSHACALTTSGGVICWGNNYSGQLGNGTDESVDTPVAVNGLSNGVTALAAGDDHTCALKGDGSVLCWGENYYGQLGDGSTEEQHQPVQVIGLPGKAASLFAGEDNTCAITESGDLYCWGNSSSRKLIPGSWEDENAATQVPGLNAAVIDVALGSNHTCTLLEDGKVRCWGENELGQLGDGTSEDREGMVQVSGLPSTKAIAAGMDYSCALSEGDDLYCWGISVTQSMVSTDQLPQFNTSPVEMENTPRDISALADGGLHLCMLTESGGVFCLGSNETGQLGDDSLFARSPVQVMELAPAPLSGFRQPGPLVPELTTYIPTPLDLSTDPKVVGTNLGLAAVAMIPFALAAELFTKIITMQEELVRKRLNVLTKPGNLMSRITLRLPSFPEWVKLVLIVLFYGVVFSLLDRSWKPFTLTGIVLLLEMTLAYGIIGLAGDLMQWRAAKRENVPASLSLRASNVLLAIASTTTSRGLKLVPGLMFGTPEALELDERTLDETKRARLDRIAALTLVGIGIGIWLPTILTAWLQKRPLSQGLETIIAGLEGFLLIIFAVALENIFIQMLGFQNTMGQKLQKRSRPLWIAALVGVTFLFYHTLINPRGELANALEVGNVRFFLTVVGLFVISTFTLWLYLKWREKRLVSPKRKEAPQVTPSTPLTVTPPSVETPEPEPSPVVTTTLPTCATCGTSFSWEESFRQVNTPGSDPYNPPGTACYRPRTFCPHCGSLVAEWHTTPTRDFNEWVWFGENQVRNEDSSLPPSPMLYGGGTTIPLQFTAYYDERQIDMEKIRAYQETQTELPMAEGPQPWQEAYNQSFALFQRGEILSSLEKAEAAVQAGLPSMEQAAIYGAIGEHYLLNQEDVETARDYLQRSIDTDPCGFWKAHFYLSLIHQARGESEQADTAYRDARRIAQTVWFTPQAETQARAVVERWNPTAAELVQAQLPEEEVLLQPSETEPPVAPPIELAEDEKRCPQCGEVIKLEARLCHYCRTRFEILIKGYCLNCHGVVSLNEDERCAQCGAEVVDRHVESRWLGEPAVVTPPIEPKPVPIPPPAVPSVAIPRVEKPPVWKSTRFWGGILVGLLGLTAVCVVLTVGGVGLTSLLGTKPTETLSAFAARGTNTPAPPRRTATRVPTSTNTSIPSPTPIPGWVTAFAEPILNAIDQVPAHVVSDFSSPAGGVYVWGCTDNNGCKITDGVMTLRSEGGVEANAGGDALVAEDFVLTFEITPKALVEGSNLGFNFRNSHAGFYGFALTFSNGAWDFLKHWGDPDTAEHPVMGEVPPIQVGETITLLFIARGNQFAVYLNDTPLAYFEDSEFTGGWKGVGIHSSSGVTEAAFDNAYFWDLSRVSGLP